MPGLGRKILIWDFDGTLGWREGMWSGALADLAGRIRPDLGHQAAAFRPHLQSGFPWHYWQKIRRAGTPPEDWWAVLMPVMRGAIEAVGGFDLHLSGFRSALAGGCCISSLHTLNTGSRAYDITHIAAAVPLNADVLLSFDGRQRTLATLVGIAVAP